MERQPQLQQFFASLREFRFSSRPRGERYHRFSDYAILSSPPFTLAGAVARKHAADDVAMYGRLQRGTAP